MLQAGRAAGDRPERPGTGAFDDHIGRPEEGSELGGAGGGGLIDDDALGGGVEVSERGRVLAEERPFRATWVTAGRFNEDHAGAEASEETAGVAASDGARELHDDEFGERFHGR